MADDLDRQNTDETARRWATRDELRDLEGRLTTQIANVRAESRSGHDQADGRLRHLEQMLDGIRTDTGAIRDALFETAGRRLMTALFRNTATTLATIAAFTTVAILGLALWAGLVPKDLLFTTSNGTSLSVNGKVDLIPPAEPIPVEIDDDGAGDLGQDTASDPLYGHGGGFGIAPVPQP